VIGVKVDSRGKMDMKELRKEIEACLEKGNDPFLVSATAGTVHYCEQVKLHLSPAD